jgi:thiol:disulfide interchange protein
MGTTGQWIEVVVAAIVFGGVMLLLEGLDLNRFGKSERTVTVKKVLVCAFTGFMAGLWSVFHWRALRWRLSLFSASAVIGAILVVAFYRPKAPDSNTHNSVPTS